MTDVNVHQLYAEVNKNTWMPVSLDFDMNFAGLGFKMKFRYVAAITDYKTTLNPALDHTFLEKLNNQQVQDQQLFEKMSPGISSIQKTVVPKSKAQKPISAL